ncbi:hypothetical protein C3L33_11236, partial [Rhododendron williamsianum]
MGPPNAIFPKQMIPNLEEAEPHYGWADVVGDSCQLLSIEPRERPPNVYRNIDFGSSPPPPDNVPPSR